VNSKERFDCKVGNQVLYRVGKKILKGKVTAIGKPNEHQHPLDIKVTWEDGKVQQLSPFDDSVAILAPQEEIPAAMAPFLRRHQLLLARATARGAWTYRLVRKADLSEVTARITEVQVCDINVTVENGKIVAREGKPMLDSSETVLCAGKKEFSRSDVETFAEWQNYYS
jgi:hypothetical protein